MSAKHTSVGRSDFDEHPLVNAGNGIAPARVQEFKTADQLAEDNIDSYELVFVNSDSGHRHIGNVEIDPDHQVVWLYELHR